MDNLGSIPKDFVANLAQAGVSDQPANGVNSLNRVAVCPEFIEGNWDGADPRRYVHDVNAWATAFKEQYPNAGVTVLVDMHREEAGPIAQAIGTDAEPLRTDLLTSVGLQAFSDDVRIPFNEDGSADVSGFFDAQRMSAVADAFGMKTVWINTGIPRTDKNADVTYTVGQRTAVATAMAGQVAQLQELGYTVEAFNIFAQDKTKREGRDFSYDPGHEPALLNLSDHMNALSVPLSGYVAPAV